MNCFIRILFVLSLTSLVYSQVINCDFSSGKVPDEVKIGRSWKVVDNVLRSVKPDGMHRFEIDAKDWHTYDIELKARRIATPPKGNHFGFIFKNNEETSRIYFYPQKAMVRVPGSKVHSQLGAVFDSPLETGPDASWFTMRISVRGREISAELNGKLIGDYDKLPPGNNKLEFYTYNSQMEISEMRFVVHKIEANVGEDSGKSPNLALNGSFEENTLDDLADYWGVPHWGIREPYWILNYDKWQQYFRLDRNTAWHGQNSLRIENVNDGPVDMSLLLCSCNFGTKVNNTYTFSAYMKADRPGVQAKMFTAMQRKPYNKDGALHALTEEWQRYSFTYTRKDNTLYSDMLRIALMNKGVIWIDGVQLEEGKEATPFQLADSDRALTVHEGNVDKQLFDVPIVKTPLLKTTPVMDGRLDDELWRQAHLIELKSTSGQAIREKSSARVFYTADGLYLGIDATEANSDQIVCSKKNRDDFVWGDPSFEIFLDSKLTRGTYHHLAFNADGVQYDRYLGNSIWNGNWQVKTARKNDNSGWTAEVFIPFSDFSIDYNNGPLWGFNLCRNNPRQKEISCWAPTFGGFHTPLRFGQLAISEEIQKQYFTGIRDIAVSYAGEGKGKLSAQIFNDTGSDRRLTVRCKLQGDKGNQKNILEKSFDLANKSSKDVVLGEISCLPGDVFRMEIEILDGKTLLCYLDRKISFEKILTAMVQYDYYTKEKELTVRGKADLFNDVLNKAKLIITVESENGTVHYKETVTPGRNFENKLPIAKLNTGNYRMKVRLISSGGKEIAQTESMFQKLPPASNEVKLDRFRRITTVNGEPFLPLGFFWEGDLTPELVEFLSKSGVNTIHTYKYRELLANPLILEAGLKNGVMFQIDVRAKKGETNKAISQLKHHPAVLSWYTYDEAFTTDWGQKNYSEITRTIEEGQKVDPYHPVVMLENQYGLNYLIEKNLYFPGKIPTIDRYAYPPAANVQTVNNTSRALMDIGAADGRPGWFVLLASGYAFHASRDMTPAEHEYMAYICAINGIRGFLYWVAYPKAPTSFKTLMRIFKELDSLKPILISLEDGPNVKCNSEDIKFTVKKHNGELYLISVNESRNAIKARFDLSEVPEAKNAQLLFEDRTLPIINSCLEDSWQGLQRHVYRIQ